MADNDTSQSHNGSNFFNQVFAGQLDRVDSWYDRLETLQKKGFEQAGEAMDNAVSLNRASMRYAQALTQDIWEIGIEAVRQGGAIFERGQN